jgi:hypothetical protein
MADLLNVLKRKLKETSLGKYRSFDNGIADGNGTMQIY